MSRLLKNRWWLFLAVVLCARSSFGQAPSGGFEFTFDPTFDPLINMSGTFESEQPIIGAGQTETALLVSFDLTNTVTGALRGSGFAVVQIGDTNLVPASYVASGRISGGGGNPTRVIISVQMTGSGVVSGVFTSFKINLRYNLIFNPETGTLDGICRGNTSFSNIGGGPVRSDSISVAIPSGGDGSWSLDLQIIPLNTLGGAGQIVTSDTRSVPGILHGVFQPGLGRSVINITGNDIGIGMGGRVILLNSEEGVVLQRMTGHALGQVINFNF